MAAFGKIKKITHPNPTGIDYKPLHKNPRPSQYTSSVVFFFCCARICSIEAERSCIAVGHVWQSTRRPPRRCPLTLEEAHKTKKKHTSVLRKTMATLDISVAFLLCMKLSYECLCSIILNGSGFLIQRVTFQGVPPPLFFVHTIFPSSVEPTVLIFGNSYVE